MRFVRSRGRVGGRRSFLLAGGLALALRATQAQAAGDELVLGTISRNPAREIEALTPLAELLALRLAEFGVRRARVHVASNAAQLAAEMKAGNVDLALDTPFAALAVAQASGARVLLRAWKGGRAEYHSVLLVRADSALRGPGDLLGKTVAFEDTYSTSGFFVPHGVLAAAGLSLRELTSVDQPVNPQDVGFVFAGGRQNAFAWLLHGRVHAIGAGEHDLANLRPDEREQLRVIARSPNVPRQVLLARAGIGASQLERLTQVLLSLDESDTGRAALKQAHDTHFDELPASSQAFMRSLRNSRAILDRALRS